MQMFNEHNLQFLSVGDWFGIVDSSGDCLDGPYIVTTRTVYPTGYQVPVLIDVVHIPTGIWVQMKSSTLVVPLSNTYRCSCTTTDNKEWIISS